MFVNHELIDGTNWTNRVNLLKHRRNNYLTCKNMVKWDRRIGTFWIINSLRKMAQHLQVTPGEMQTFTFYIQYNIHIHLHLHRYWTISIGTMLHSAAARWQNLMKWRRTSSEVPEVWHEKHVWQSENSNNEPCICKYTLMLQSLLQVVLEVFFWYLNTEPPRLFVALGINDQHQSTLAINSFEFPVFTSFFSTSILLESK